MKVSPAGTKDKVIQVSIDRFHLDENDIKEAIARFVMRNKTTKEPNPHDVKRIMESLVLSWGGGPESFSAYCEFERSQWDS